MASFVTLTKSSNTNEAVNTAHGVSAASTQVNTAYSKNIDNLRFGVHVMVLVDIDWTSDQAQEGLIMHSWLTQLQVLILRPKAVVNAVKGNNVNVVKALACWVWKPKTKVLDHGNPQMDLQDQGVIDSGCSRHMTGNMSYLTNYEEIYGGYVAFGREPRKRENHRKILCARSCQVQVTHGTFRLLILCYVLDVVYDLLVLRLLCGQEVSPTLCGYEPVRIRFKHTFLVMSPPARASRAKFHWGTAFVTGRKRFTDPETKLRIKHTNRRVRIPKGLYSRRIEEKLTKKQVGEKWISSQGDV
ncbi:hypothetical protein Tco_1142646 [Tanacetum coccineum]